MIRQRLPMTRIQARSVDRIAIERLGFHSLVLMENAGRGAAEIIHSVLPTPEAKVVVLCGTGNNGGDGFVLARHLALLGHLQIKNWIITKHSAQLESKLSADAKANYSILRNLGLAMQVLTETTMDLFRTELKSADIIVDAMIGSGGVGELQAPLNRVVEMANECKALKVAIDIPSGLDCDTGKAGTPCFISDHTITFVAPKIGFDLGDGPRFTGRVSVVDIGFHPIEIAIATWKP